MNILGREPLGRELLASEQARFDEVCRFGQDRIEPLAETIAAAFGDDPVWNWLFGDDEPPLANEPARALARLMISRISPIDEIHGFRHHGSVALWYAPKHRATATTEAWSATNAAPYAEAIAPFFEATADRAQAISAAMAKARPAEPHWYLSIVGTDPAMQGTGLGAAVLAPMLARCDREAIPAYLESSNPRNHAFYHRLGFSDADEIAALDSPPLLGMWRAPK